MSDVVLHVDAAEEMRAAAAHYESRAVGLGEEFLREVEYGFTGLGSSLGDGRCMTATIAGVFSGVSLMA